MVSDGKFNWRFGLSAIAIIVVIAALGIFSVYTAANGIRDSTRDELKSVAGVMATQINASDIAGLKPGDESSARYRALVDHLLTMRSMNDRIVNAYIMKVGTGGDISFIADDLYFDDPAGSAKIGDSYLTPDKMEIFGALSLPTASQQVYTDKYGTFISGYAPIDTDLNGSSGNTVAVLGVDMAATTYTDEVRAAGMAIVDATLISMAIIIVILWFATRKCRQETRGMEEKKPFKWEKGD
ncbi:MAG TPA: hypothetical protein VMC42_10290 [Methanoregulaceae archaeon]|nr:hypothetical protein [Methanoregulaceae archaeon]